MGLQSQIQKLESDALREAIVANAGNLGPAADALGIAKSTLTSKLKRKYPELLDQARTLRDKIGNGRGRPRIRETERTRRAVTVAWEKSGHVYSVAARELKIPASSMSDLVLRYGLPIEKPKSKTSAKKKPGSARKAKRARRKARAEASS